jgi:hypothetical protein
VWNISTWEMIMTTKNILPTNLVLSLVVTPV